MTDTGGQIVTFYSYKGGTGRTMALANVAWILASSGKRVLVVDWDLESPGLHRFFGPFVDSAEIERNTAGVIDLIRRYVDVAEQTTEPVQLPHRNYARVNNYSFTIDWDHFPPGATLDFLAAGQLQDYDNSVAKVDWTTFYDNYAGGLLFDALRQDMIRNYDYALIDSRTGLSDVADICTIQLPDILVDCFTMSEQGIAGAAKAAENVRRLGDGRRPVRILPVLMRVEQGEMAKISAGAAVAKQSFTGLPSHLPEDERERYWSAMRVPYWPFYAYEETLAVFDELNVNGSLLSAYELLTSYLTEGTIAKLPPLDATLRAATKAKFERIPHERVDAVTLWYAPADAVWAEWATAVLERAGVTVRDPALADPVATSAPNGPIGGAKLSRPLLIVSQHKPPAEFLANGSGKVGPLALRVGDLLPQVPRHQIATISGPDATTGARDLLALVGRPGLSAEELAACPRFPATEPDPYSAPMPDRQFTGRDAELAALRALFRPGAIARGGSAAPPIVAISGLGGMGKTELAKAYAYRFRSAYDVVWWIPADATRDVDSALAALAARLELPVPSSNTEAARAMVQALAKDEIRGRWLLIFDNAERVERLAPLLPKGKGHVLLTSRLDWSEHAHIYPMSVFSREDSLTHLRTWAKIADPAGADRLATALSDIPIAVASAGQYLLESGTPISTYLEDIEKDGEGVLSLEDAEGRRVDAIWDLPLELLQSRSTAAYRMLEICSVFAPDIAYELVTSPEMAQSLKPLDRRVSDPTILGRLIQELNRFGLVKIDRTAAGDTDAGGPGQSIVQIHRLLQRVMRRRMTTREMELIQHEAHLILAGAQPYGRELDVPDNGSRYRMIWPHLEASDASTCWDWRVRQLLVDRTRYFYLRGDARRGREMAESVERTWIDMLASEREDTDYDDLRRQLLQLRFNKANLLRDAGRFEESYALDTSVYTEQTELLGEDHSNTLMTAGSLAADLRGLGRYAEALARDERTHADWLREEGPQHPRTLSALSNLAVSHRLVGHVYVAERLDQEVFEARKQLLGLRNPNTLLTGGSLGRDLREAGKYVDSVELLKIMRDVAVELDGPGSRLALNAMANLAVSLRSAGNVDDAVGLLDEACAKLPALVGDGPDVWAARLSRSMNRLELNRLDEAESELADVQAEYLRTLGAEHPHHLACLSNAAAVARAQGDLPKARGLASDAFDALRTALGSDHPTTLAAQLNLSICQVELGDVTTGRAGMNDTANRISDLLGGDHPLVLRYRANCCLAARHGRRVKPTVEERGLIERLASQLGQTHSVVTALQRGELVHRIIDPHPY